MGCSCDETPYTDSVQCSCCCVEDERPRTKEHGLSEFHILAIRFILAAVFFTLGMFFDKTADSEKMQYFSRILFFISWLVAGYSVVLSAAKNIRHGKIFDENFLMSAATIGAFIIGQWNEAAAVMLFYNLGEMIQEYAVSHSRRSITELVDIRPNFARYDTNGRTDHPAHIPTGTIIRVLPGEKVPLDGIIVAGTSGFDTSGLTGESIPRDALPGGEALAGFVNTNGVLRIKTTTNYTETAASKMLKLISDARNHKAKTERLITSFARIYTPIVTICAVLLALIPSLYLLISGEGNSTGWQLFRPWVYRALVFLVISCPCAFVISVPLGFFAGIGGAARKGILVKGADYIDVLAKAQAVVFDKTGTLTKGVFQVQTVEPASNYSREFLIKLAATAELYSLHPVGVAVREYATMQGFSPSDEDINHYTERAGFGVRMDFDGKPLIVGSHRLLTDSNISGIPDIPKSSVATAIEVGYDGIYIGRINLSDKIRPTVFDTIAKLRKEGIQEIALLTGDSEAVARDVARQIGITDFQAAALPHQKVAFFEKTAERIKKDKKAATILFVGDGVNDAPVLARADAGLAMGGIGSDAAVEAADVVLMNDNPALVPEAIASARWTRHIVMENIILAFAIKIGFLLLGAAGIVTLGEAVFADVGVTLLATANSLRARTAKQLA